MREEKYESEKLAALEWLLVVLVKLDWSQGKTQGD
jgi:hypothetical protein